MQEINFAIPNFLEYITEERKNKIIKVLSQRTRFLTVLMENFFDPRNIAAVIRTCDAFGIQDLHVLELDHPFFISRRVSKGADNWLNIYKYNQTELAVSEMRKKGYQLFYADPDPSHPNLDELDLSRKTALVFGQEKNGISPQMIKLCDGGFRIPLHGFVDSFNVSVACALTLHHCTNRLLKNPPPDYHIPSGDKEILLQHWLARNTLAGNLLRKIKQQKKYLLQEPYLIP
jgi:tRNA (guanosine-2'-O-)-methyltransferase